MADGEGEGAEDAHDGEGGCGRHGRCGGSLVGWWFLSTV